MSTRARGAGADAARARSRTIGYACCFALAAQYGAQPLLVRAFVRTEVSRASLVLATEACKATLAVAMLCARGSFRDEIKHSVAHGRGVAFAALPAVLYAVQNVLSQYGYANLDGVSFNCLNQSKLVSAALFVYVFSGVRQSFAQCVALLGVMGAGIRLSAHGGASSPSDATNERYAFGALAVCAASALSGLSGALGQVALKRHGKSAPMLTLEMAIVGAPVVVLTEYYFNQPGASIFDLGALFEHWNAFVWIPVCTAAVAGLLVGEITKRLEQGVIAKGFAVVGGLVLTGVCQSAMTRGQVPRAHLVCLLVVLVSVYVHTVSPPVEPKKRKVV